MALIKLNNQSLTNVTAAGLPSGTVLQVKYTQFTSYNNVAISNSATGTALDDLAVNITPISTNSIILLTAFINGEFSAAAAHDAVAFFFRDSTKLAAPAAGNRALGVQMGANISFYDDNNSSTPEGFHYSYFDTPSTTSQITYRPGLRVHAACNYKINRTESDADLSSNERGVSFISATEIAG